jgi:hypothetical protein
VSRRVWLRRCGFSEEGEGTGPRLPVRHSADLPSLPLLDAGSFGVGGSKRHSQDDAFYQTTMDDSVLDTQYRPPTSVLPPAI